MIATSKVEAFFGSVAKTARFFKCEISAVYQWREKKPGKRFACIPKRREYELNLRLPKHFPPSLHR